MTVMCTNALINNISEIGKALILDTHEMCVRDGTLLANLGCNSNSCKVNRKSNLMIPRYSMNAPYKLRKIVAVQTTASTDVLPSERFMSIKM